jgi:hypothetical protein
MGHHIGSCLADFSAQECAAYLVSAGYGQPNRKMPLEQSKGVLLIASSSKSGRVRPARMRNALPTQMCAKIVGRAQSLER